MKINSITNKPTFNGKVYYINKQKNAVNLKQVGYTYPKGLMDALPEIEKELEHKYFDLYFKNNKTHPGFIQVIACKSLQSIIRNDSKQLNPRTYLISKLMDADTFLKFSKNVIDDYEKLIDKINTEFKERMRK